MSLEEAEWLICLFIALCVLNKDAPIRLFRLDERQEGVRSQTGALVCVGHKLDSIIIALVYFIDLTSFGIVYDDVTKVEAACIAP